MSEARAHLVFLRQSPRKLGLLAGLIRGKRVGKAIDILRNLPQAGGKPILKLLESAVANAANNHKMDKNGLMIKSIIVNQGPVLKRFKPRAMGRAAPIRKPTCHISITVADGK